MLYHTLRPKCQLAYTGKARNLQSDLPNIYEYNHLENQIFPAWKQNQERQNVAGYRSKKHTNIKAGWLDKARNWQNIIGYYLQTNYSQNEYYLWKLPRTVEQSDLPYNLINIPISVHRQSP